MTERISKAQLRAWRAELEQWMAPDVFKARVDDVMNMPREVFFRQPGLQFLRDAWIAGRVASALGSPARLCCGERPDFEVKTPQGVLRFEATEADEDERRRGDENTSAEIEFDPVEDWRARFEAIPSAMKRVIAKKVGKVYEPDVNLIVYVNLNAYGAYLKEGIPILAQCTRDAKDSFKAVFVLWEGWLFRFWHCRKPDASKWKASVDTDF